MKQPVRTAATGESDLPLRHDPERRRKRLNIRWLPGEKENREEGSIFRLMVEKANVPIVVTQDYRIKFVNRKAGELLGITGEELISRPFEEFFHPDDWDLVRKRHRNRMVGDDLLHVYPIRIPDREGNVGWFEVNCVKFTWKGRPADLIVLQGITREKKTEEALRAREEEYRDLFQNANSIILRRDTEGRVTFFNEYAQEFFGYREEEILGKSVLGTIVPRVDSRGNDLCRMIRDISLHPERYETNESENIRRDGIRVWIAWTNKAIRDSRGQVREILSIGNDITEQKLLEEHLIQLQKMEAFGRLTGVIAHDFNNLLTVIAGVSEIILTDLEPDQSTYHLVNQIKKAGEKAASLTQQLMAFSSSHDVPAKRGTWRS